MMWRLDRDGRRVQLWQRNYQDKYGDPGSPKEVRNSRGQLVLQTVRQQQQRRQQQQGQRREEEGEGGRLSC